MSHVDHEAMERAAIAPLLPYQLRWIHDESRLKAALWTRSAGKTHVISLEPVIDCHRADAAGKPVNWFCFSASEGQTKEIIRYAAIHSKAIDTATAFEAEEEEHIVVDEDGKRSRVTMLSLQFEHGSRLVGLPTNPSSIRGKHGHLLGDEMGHIPNAKALWQAAGGIATRGFKVRLTGTANERSGPFYEIVSGAQPGWAVHKLDIHQAIAEGAPINLEHVYALYGRGRTFATEFLLQFEDAESRLVSLELILPCEDSTAALAPLLWVKKGNESEWQPHLDRQRLEPAPSDGYDDPAAWKRFFAPLAGRTLYLGYDVARRRDLAVLTIVEPEGALRHLRALVVFEGRRFTEQEGCVYAALEMCRRGCIDSTGIGAQLAERAQERFGTHRVEAVTFTSSVKEDLAVRLLRQFEDRTARVPPNVALRESIHSVYKLTTAAGNVRYDADSTEETGHADHFWSFGLALMAAGDGGAGVNLNLIQTAKPYTWSRARGLG